MVYEREGLLLPAAAPRAIDSDIHESFVAAHLGAAETFTDLEPGAERLAELETAFLASSGTMDVDLRASHLDGDELRRRETALLDWKRDTLAGYAGDRDIIQAYRWAVNESIGKIRMLEASRDGDMRRFGRLNEFVYGTPDETVYRAALDWMARQSERIAASRGGIACEAAERTAELLSGRRGYRELLDPDSGLFERVRHEHFKAKGYYGLLLANVELPQKGTVGPDVGEPAIEQVLANMQAPFERRYANSKTWSVSPSGRTLSGPREYAMPVRRFVGLPLGHEGGSHTLEYMNAQRGPLALAISGLDRYEQTGEGRPLVREQVVYDSFAGFTDTMRWRDVLRRHIATAYGAGSGDEPSHRFSEVYDFMYALELPFQLRRHEDQKGAAEATHHRTWRLVGDVLKGTDGQGGAQLRRKLYLEGNVAIWLQAGLEGAEVVGRGDLGKFDITNPRHIGLLQTYGLLPEQLETIG